MNNKSIYEIALMQKINKISNDVYENISCLDKYPLSVSKKVLEVLISNACLGQNIMPITLGRKKIGEIINHNWLMQYFMEVADEVINYSDEWEYQRLLELVMICIPELKEEILSRGINSENEAIREIIEDYKDCVKMELIPGQGLVSIFKNKE